MVDPTGRSTLHTDPQAVWHLGRTPNEVNRANQTTRNLPDSVVVSQRGAVTLVRLSRPAKRNALDIEMMVGIERIFSSPPEGSRAIVLYGDGSHFCAGADLARVAETDGASALRLSRIAHQAFDRIEYGAVPVVAALQGAVIGGGLEIAAAAHIRVAEQSAFYALPEGMRGIFVEGASLGFSQYVVENGQKLAKAIELAERIASNAALSNFAVVQALPRIARSDPEAGLLMESLMWAMTTNEGEAKVRIQDFLEKRATRVFHRSESGPPIQNGQVGE